MRSKASAPGAWLRKERQVQRARGVVVSAGPLGTNKLLQRCRLNGSLGRISARLGELVRTNSESILTVTVPEDYPGRPDRTRRDHLLDLSRSEHPHRDRHLRRRRRLDAPPLHAARRRRHAPHASAEVAPPGPAAPAERLAQVLFPKHYSRRTIIMLVMQTLDNAIALRPRQGPFGTLWLKTEQDPEKPNPTFIPVANQAAEWFAKRTGGIAQSSTTEALFNIPTTAHILGGAVIAPDPSTRRDRRPPARVSATRTCSSATARRSPRTSASTHP